MTAEVTERSGEIRGVTVRWIDVIVEGHTVEQVLLFDVAEAEAVHGRPFDDELDKHIQMGMFAMDRISADGTMHKVASATSYVLDGKCMRTAKIEHCRDIEPDERRLANHPSGWQRGFPGTLELRSGNAADITWWADGRRGLINIPPARPPGSVAARRGRSGAGCP